MMRENIKKLITYELVYKREILSHKSCLSERLEVYPDGTILETQHISNNEWHVLKGTTQPVAEIDSFYHSCGCNCDWCTDWENSKNDPEYKNDDGINSFKECEGNFDSFLEDCISNSDWSASNKIEEICENIDNIEYGYFEDESEPD